MDSWDVRYLLNIFLLDSEANNTHKRIIREAMRASIDHRKISRYQYIKPQHSAVVHRTHKILVLDYQQYLRQPLSLSCSDLKCCCDIIFHSAAILALQRLGIPLPSIISMIYRIQNMSHKVRT